MAASAALLSSGVAFSLLRRRSLYPLQSVDAPASSLAGSRICHSGPGVNLRSNIIRVGHEKKLPSRHGKPTYNRRTICPTSGVAQ